MCFPPLSHKTEQREIETQSHSNFSSSPQIIITMAPSALSKAIANEEWSLATKIAKQYPEQARKKSNRDGFFDGQTNSKLYPLHEALVANAPFQCIKAIVEAYPPILRKPETSYNRLPLHCACRKNANPSVVAYLIEQYKPACLEEDSLLRLPIHYALTNGANPEVISILMQADPASARGYDRFGWTPVHVAVNVGASPRIVESMLKAFPESVLLKTNKRNSMRSVVPKLSPHQEEHRRLINETRQAVTLSLHLPSLRQNSMRASRMIMV